MLKGAMLFTYWTEEPHRATRDLDLLGFGEPNQQRLHEIFRQLLEHPDEADGLVFNVSRLVVKPIREEQRYGGQRITVPCTLGRTRIPLQIDVSFGGAVESEREQLSTLLALPQPILRVCSRVAVVAEKPCSVPWRLSSSRWRLQSPAGRSPSPGQAKGPWT